MIGFFALVGYVVIFVAAWFLAEQFLIPAFHRELALARGHAEIRYRELATVTPLHPEEKPS